MWSLPVFLTAQEVVTFNALCSPEQMNMVMTVANLPPTRALVVELPEQKSTFGHFIENFASVRGSAVPLAFQTQRKLYFQRTDTSGFYTDFENYFGLPNGTSMAWGKTPVAYGDPYGPDPIVKISFKGRGNKCFIFATTRPVNEVREHLHLNVGRVVGLHLRTGYADHAAEMDGGKLNIHQFSVRYPELLDKGMDGNFAAYSPRRDVNRDGACGPLFYLLKVSETVKCLDSLDNVSIVLATDHAKYQPVLNALVKRNTLLSPERIRNKSTKDVFGHGKYVSYKDGPDFDALGIVAAIEFHLLTWCDLLVTYGGSFFSYSAAKIAVPLHAQHVSLNLPRNISTVPFCDRGCYTPQVCDCLEHHN